ncbi:MAG: divergent polysaccharide deacetylase family protein [Desulfohalobiaceae bacterium]
MGKQKTGKRTQGGSRKRSSGSSRRNAGFRPVLLITAVIVTGAALLVALSLPPRGPQGEQVASREKAPEVEQTTSTPDAASGKTASTPSEDPSGDGERKYEELPDPFTQAVEKVDLALMQSLANAGVQPDKLRHVSLDYRRKGNQKYRFQEIELWTERRKGRRVLSELEGLLEQWLSKAALEPVPQADGIWRVRLQGAATHRIVLRAREKPGKEKKAVPESDAPRIALVMDDMGKSLERANRLLRLSDGAIALSVLPRSPYSEEIARAAKSRGADVLLHLPMEPKSYPEADPGPGALFVGMRADRIRSVLKRNLEGIPGIVGVNNHMGSRFTAAKAPMREVLITLRHRDLFYMDSLTSPDTVGRELAPRIGVRTITRDIFLDNEKDVESIIYQFRKAEHLAREEGYAVVTGHPYPQTVEALRQWLANKDDDIRLCRLSRIVQTQNDSQAERSSTHGTADAGDY